MTDAALPAPPPLDSPSPEQPAPAGQPARPPLRRSGTDRLLGGVCGGLAEHTGIDALLWRIGAVALTLAGGSGVVLYLRLWVLMAPAPRGPQDQVAPLDRMAERLHTALSGTATPPRRD